MEDKAKSVGILGDTDSLTLPDELSALAEGLPDELHTARLLASDSGSRSGSGSGSNCRGCLLLPSESDSGSRSGGRLGDSVDEMLKGMDAGDSSKAGSNKASDASLSVSALDLDGIMSPQSQPPAQAVRPPTVPCPSLGVTGVSPGPSLGSVGLSGSASNSFSHASKESNPHEWSLEDTDLKELLERELEMSSCNLASLPELLEHVECNTNALQGPLVEAAPQYKDKSLLPGTALSSSPSSPSCQSVGSPPRSVAATQVSNPTPQSSASGGTLRSIAAAEQSQVARSCIPAQSSGARSSEIGGAAARSASKNDAL